MMSTTGNEFEQPGVNYPDREDAHGALDMPDEHGSARDAPSTADDPAVGIDTSVPGNGTDHHGQDAGRDTLSAGQAQRAPGGLGADGEQSRPAMSQNNASTDDKVDGIVAQTRVDVGTESSERIAHVLRQRFEQSGIDMTDDDVDRLAQRVASGD